MLITLPEEAAEVQLIGCEQPVCLAGYRSKCTLGTQFPEISSLVCWGCLSECIYCGTEAAVVTYPPMLGPAGETRDVDVGAPIEYAAAVGRDLARAALGVGSRRVYRISLAGWAWPLVGKPVPSGADRRRATPPVVPLALLDDPGTGARLAAALAQRAATTDARTVNRELSALRSAVGWWRERGWIAADPTTGLRHRQPAALALPLGRSPVG